MYMKKIYWMTVAVVVCCLSSCYEDKGNYDYKLMNDVTVNFTMEATEFVMGDVLKVEPQLAFSLGEETNKLAYSWSLNRRQISTDRNLNWMADEEGKYMDLRLTVTDTETGVSYFYASSITVTSPYVNNAWVVLSEKEDGTAMLTYLRPTTKIVPGENGKEDESVYDCAVTKDVYGISNAGSSLGGEPISISQHFVSSWTEDRPQDFTSWLWLVQQGGQGTIDVSGSTYKTEGTLPSMFIHGAYPQGFEPWRVYDMLYLSMAIGMDGKVYTRIKDSYKLFNNSYFMDELPLSYRQQPVDGTMIVRAPRFCDHGGTLLYDKNSKRYFHITDYQSWNGRKYCGQLIVPSITNESIYEKNPDWGKLDDMSDYEVLYVDAHSDDSWMGLKYAAVLRKSNRYFLQDFTIGDYWGGSSIDAEINSQTDVTSELGAIVKEDSQFALYYAQDYRPYLLISSGNLLYFYYFNGSKVYKYHQFDAPIKSIDVNNSSFQGDAGVGLENGEFYVLDFSTSVIRDVMNTGDSKEKIRFKQGGLGKVVEVIYKWKQAANWV